MKKALVSPQEQSHIGLRIADVHPTGFEVAEPLFWIECADDVSADLFYYNPTNSSIGLVPVPEVKKILLVDGKLDNIAAT